MKILQDENGKRFVDIGHDKDLLPVLFKYIRDDFNRKVGVVVSLEYQQELRFGYAKFNPDREEGKPNNDRAFQIAVGRALKRNDINFPFLNNKNGRPFPPGVQPLLIELYGRSIAYFKVEE